MILFPKCKINLGLNIVAKRPDGYHDIETVMYPIGWSDILEIVPSTGDCDTLTVTGMEVDCPAADNLVMKAVRLLRERYSFPWLDIRLHKIVPFGAGLGGGSADAACTVNAVCDMYLPEVTLAERADIASRLGADCPFFLYGRPMLATGTGTDLAPIDVDLSRYRIAAVKPQVAVPTRDAYARVTPQPPSRSLADDMKLPPEEWSGKVKNDFENSVFPQYPSIAEVKDALLSEGAVYASMTGSGAAVIGIFKNDILAERLKERLPGCDIYVDSEP